MFPGAPIESTLPDATEVSPSVRIVGDVPKPPVNLQSSIKEVGPTTTQIFHFVGNVKRTIHGIITASIKDGEMFKSRTKDGRMIMINRNNLLMTEVFNEDE